MSADAPTEFLDTNVLVYAHDRGAGAKHERAVSLLEDLVGRDAAALSVQVLQEWFVTVTGKIPHPLPAAEAVAVLSDLATLVVHSPDAADVLAAAGLRQRLGVSFWDAMIIRSASQLGCQVLWSEDLTDGQRYEGVELRNPFATT